MSRDQYQFKIKVVIYIAGGAGKLEFNYPQYEIHFNSVFSDEPTPSETTIDLYNLSAPTRNKIKKGQNVTLSAGFGKDVGVVTHAKIKYIHPPIKDGGDSMFELICDEGVDYSQDKREFTDEKPENKKQIQVTFQKGVNARYVMNTLSRKAGLGMQIVSLKKEKTYPKGYSASGRPIDALQEVAEYTGSKLMYRRGKLIVRDTHKGFDTNFTLDSEHGLISSPEREEDDDWQGYSVTSIFNHLFATASIIKMRSLYVRGTFRIKSGEHSFDGEKPETSMEIEAQ